MTVNLWPTDGAAAKVPLPLCEATIVHVPETRRVTELLDTAQTLRVEEA